MPQNLDYWLKPKIFFWIILMTWGLSSVINFLQKGQLTPALFQKLGANFFPIWCL
jgi:hypothetical protein